MCARTWIYDGSQDGRLITHKVRPRIWLYLYITQLQLLRAKHRMYQYRDSLSHLQVQPICHTCLFFFCFSVKFEFLQIRSSLLLLSYHCNEEASQWPNGWLFVTNSTKLVALNWNFLGLYIYSGQFMILVSYYQIQTWNWSIKVRFQFFVGSENNGKTLKTVNTISYVSFWTIPTDFEIDFEEFMLISINFGWRESLSFSVISYDFFVWFTLISLPHFRQWNSTKLNLYNLWKVSFTFILYSCPSIRKWGNRDFISVAFNQLS